MSYQINIECYEQKERAYVDIQGHSEHFTSARISQLQCIGWLLDIRDNVLSRTEAQYVENPEYLEEALHRLAGLKEEHAAQLCRLETESEQFAYVWSLISPEQQHLATTLDYSCFDNFWSDGLIPSPKPEKPAAMSH